MNRPIVLILAILAVTAAAVSILVLGRRIEGGKKMIDDSPKQGGDMQIVSPVFKEGGQIPPPYTCKGQNLSPPLNFVSVPADTKSLVLILHDPDAPSGDFVHWLMWDIPADTGTIAANSVPVGAVQGPNNTGQNNYTGPCPPSGTHRYMFELYALDTTLGLPSNTERDALLTAMGGHILEKAVLTGTFSA